MIMKKKVGLLTYHNAINYGAALQCTALLEYLSKKYPKYNFQIINYRNIKIANSNSMLAILKNNKFSFKQKLKKIVGYIFIKNKIAKFQNFLKNINISEEYTRENIQSINKKYDFYIIGSDQVWNYKINNNDDTYFLDIVNDKNKIFTYASSIGLDDFDSEFKKKIRNNVSKYNMISVREETAKIMIEECINRKVYLVLDPVFLKEKNEWEKMISKNKSKKNILYYIFNKEYVRQANDIVSNCDLRLHTLKKINGNIKINDFFNPKVRIEINSGPKEFVEMIYNSEMIFTDSFHCVAMSIILHKNFLVFIDDKIMETNSRICNLLKIAGLENRIYNKNKKNQVEEKIDWEIVDSNISKYKIISENYLDDVINKMK